MDWAGKMTSFTREQLQALKRKDLIALCKEHDIKCVGKNAELIEKLMESSAVTASVSMPDAKMKEPIHENPQESCNGLCAEESNVEEARVEPSEQINEIDLDQPESAIQVDADQTFHNRLNIESNFNQAEEVSHFDTNKAPQNEPTEEFNEVAYVSQAEANQPYQNQFNNQLDPCDEIILERRKSQRLSAAHLKKTMTPVKPSPLATEDKENVKKGLYNRNISHIPTLKERVSKLASVPLANTRRPSDQAQQPKRQRFDLKESLKRPLGYKPYTGPVKKSTI